jgi:hypothetical protein
MMFISGIVVIILSLVLGSATATHLKGFNWGERIALAGVVAGTVMCVVSVLMAIWKHMP